MALGFLPSVGPTEALILVMTAALLVWPACRICTKAGYPGAMGLLSVVPGLNLGLLVFLAVADWPALGPGRAKAEKARERG